MQALKAFISKYRTIIVGILCFYILFQVNSYNYNRYKEAKNEATRLTINLKASQDSIVIVKNRAKEDEANKLAYVVKNIEELRQINADLAEEVKNTKGLVKTIQKINVEIRTDTVEIPAIITEISDTSVTFISKQDTVFSEGNYRNLSIENTYNFKTNLAKSIVLNDEIGFTAVLGMKEENNQYKFFVTPKHPGMKIIDIEGAIIDKDFFKQETPKKKKISLGMNVGLVPVTYDFKTKNVDVNLQRVGVSAGININL